MGCSPEIEPWQHAAARSSEMERSGEKRSGFVPDDRKMPKHHTTFRTLRNGLLAARICQQRLAETA